MGGVPHCGLRGGQPCVPLVLPVLDAPLPPQTHTHWALLPGPALQAVLGERSTTTPARMQLPEYEKLKQLVSVCLSERVCERDFDQCSKQLPE